MYNHFSGIVRERYQAFLDNKKQPVALETSELQLWIIFQREK